VNTGCRLPNEKVMRDSEAAYGEDCLTSPGTQTKSNATSVFIGNIISHIRLALSGMSHPTFNVCSELNDLALIGINS
jgi:hypothetical protein